MGNDTSLACRLGRRVDTVTPCCWTLFDGLADEGKPPLSVFVYNVDDNSPDSVEHAAKLLKILRHPGILSFHSISLATPKTLWLVTERVVPLPVVLDVLSPTEICSGLYNVIDALAFLHDRGGLCHNSFSVGSVFVAVDGTWKLGSVECACLFKDATQAFLLKQKRLRPAEIIASEEKNGLELPVELRYSRDVYAFGLFADYVLEYLTSFGKVAKRFQMRIQEECLSEDPQQRPRLHTLLDDELFQNDFVEIINFLKKITMKSAEEKKVFFSSLVERLYSLPEELVASRLTKLLTSRFVILDPYACQYLLPHFLTPGSDEKEIRSYNASSQLNPILGELLFKRYLIPELFKIFHIRDAPIRIILLTHFHRYLKLFEIPALADVIFPQILLSVRDSNDELVVTSLRAIADLVPVLGGDVVIGTDRMKLFSEGIPRQFATINGCAVLQSNGTAGSREAQAVKDGFSVSADRQRQRDESKRRILERRKKKEEERQRTDKQSEITDDYAEVVKQSNSEFAEATEYPSVQSETEEFNRIESIDDGNDFLKDETPTHTEPTDSDIELEIQNELIALGSNQSTPKKSQAETTPERIDWSDVGLHKTLHQQHSNSLSPSGRGSLKLSNVQTVDNKSQSNKGVDRESASPSDKSSTRVAVASVDSKHSSPNISSKANNSLSKHLLKNRTSSKEHIPIKLSDDWNDNDWGSFDTHPVSPSTHQSSISTELFVKPTSPTLTRQSDFRTVRSNSNQPLGAEFDIMMINVKPIVSKEEGGGEFDFFADMAPQIRQAEKGLLGMLAQKEKVPRVELPSNHITERSIVEKSAKLPDISLRVDQSLTDRGVTKDQSTFGVSYSGNVDEEIGWDMERDEEIDDV